MSDMYRYVYMGDNFVEKFESPYEAARNYKFQPLQKTFRKFSSIDFLISSGIQFESVCECGAGGGTNLVPLIGLGKKCTGYEYGKQLIDFGRGKGINLICGGIEALSENYDLIMLIHVIEHFLHPVKELKRLSEFTNKYLLVEIPGICTRIPSIQNAHQFYFSINTILKIASMAGFKCIQYKVFTGDDIIIALFEKDGEDSFHYDFAEEKKNSLPIINKGKIRFVGRKLLNMLKKGC